MKILVAGRGFDSRSHHEVGIFELDQAKALCEAGHDVRFAALDTRSVRRSRPFGYYSYCLSDIPVFYGSLPCGGLPFGLPGKIGEKAVRGIFRRVTADGWRPDVIHQHFACDFGVVAEQEHIPFVVTEHSSLYNKVLPADVADRLRRDYSRADALVAVSSALARNMEKNTGFSPVVIPNIVDAEIFSRAPREHEDFLFVSTANLVEDKCIPMLIRAFARLDGSPRLTIFGSGEQESAVRELIRQLGLAERVTLRGHCPREELAAAYAEADCFVLPSRSETFGLAYVEAMAAGLPVIATRCGGPEDFVNESNGLLVPVDDEDALTAAMEKMMLQRGAYIPEEISRFARSRFSPAQIAGELTELYEELVSC